MIRVMQNKINKAKDEQLQTITAQPKAMCGINTQQN